MAYNRDAVKRQARALAKRGLSVREIAERTATSKSTVHRWIAGVLPAPSSTPSSKVSAPDPEPDTDASVVGNVDNVDDVDNVPVTDTGTDPERPDAVDFDDLEFLKEERSKLYRSLREGYDRAAALLYVQISREILKKQEMACADHWTIDEIRELCTRLNGLWQRHLEIAVRDMEQIGYADAQRILDKAIRKVQIEAETLT